MSARRLLPAALILAAGLVLSACSAATGTAEPAISTRSSVAVPPSDTTPSDTEIDVPSSAPTSSSEPAPSTTRTPPSTATAPEAVLEAGTVTEGTPVSLSGQGPTTVSLVRSGDFAVVARLDCSTCAGDVELTGPGRSTPFGKGQGPFTGTFLVEILADSAAEQELYVVGDGAWTLELLSWNDLPPVQGEQTGSRSMVLFVADEVPGFDFRCTPLPDESCHVRAVSAVAAAGTGPDSRLFGDSVEFTETVDLHLPGIVTITTNGSWTLTPRG